MYFLESYPFIWKGFIAGIFASIACGLGALPAYLPYLRLEKRIGLGYSFTGGMMFSASMYNLLLPAFTLGKGDSSGLAVLKVVIGMFIGCLFLAWVEKYFSHERLEQSWWKAIGGKLEVILFLTMCLHSVPEGVAVGVGYASESHFNSPNLGLHIAIAIAIHNIPEGLAVAIPLRAQGASFTKSFFLAFLTSLPQPLASVPAGLLVWFFKPLFLPFLGFAAGAMMYLVLLELIPSALESHSATEMAMFFMLGFGLMALIQVSP